jgi:hypothetical protein
VLLGDVLYTDSLMDEIYNNREKFPYRLYGDLEEVYALTYIDNEFMARELWNVLDSAINHNGTGELMELPYLDYVIVNDGTRDFNELKEYEEWLKQNK